jgi:hypothetical protein
MEIMVSFDIPDAADNDTIATLSEELVDFIRACTAAMGAPQTAAMVRVCQMLTGPPAPAPASASLPGGMMRIPFYGRVS